MKGVYPLENIEVDLISARKWYNDVENKYQRLKWYAGKDVDHPYDIEEAPNEYKDTYAWSLSILETYDPDQSYHMHLNPLEKDYRKYINTTICYDWGRKVVDFFPKSYRNFLFVSTPGTKLPVHRDGSDYYRIHIPLITNDQCIWFLEDGEFTMPAGKVYLVDVRCYHGTINNSQNSRVHVTLEIKKHDADYI
jgi:hypothetical protein